MPREQLALSILSADFTRLAEDIEEAEAAGADCFHLDIMDGHFVPNISFGPEVVRQVNRITDQFLDVHLMITDPDRYIGEFTEAGADLISIHVEACPHLHRSLEAIKKLGCQAGVAINPATPLSTVEEVLSLADQIILMSVNPGFGGQKFITATLDKLERLSSSVRSLGLNTVIEMDGGVNKDNIAELVSKGAKRLVVGSAVFNSAASISANLEEMRALIK